MFWIFAILSFLFIGSGISYLIYFFSPSSHNLKSEETSSVVTRSLPSTPAGAPSSFAVQPEQFSTRYRLVGFVNLHGLDWAVVVDQSGIFRFENPNKFYGRPPISVGDVDGSKVTRWTGAPSSQSSSVFPSGASK
jgi:zona occludens toxin